MEQQSFHNPTPPPPRELHVCGHDFCIYMYIYVLGYEVPIRNVYVHMCMTYWNDIIFFSRMQNKPQYKQWFVIVLFSLYGLIWWAVDGFWMMDVSLIYM